MAQVTSYSQLLPFVLPEVPGCSPDIATFWLRRYGRRFCERSEAWREDLAPIAIVDYQQDYNLLHPYSAQVHRIIEVRVNSIVQPPSRYGLWEDKWLRFAGNAIPHDQSDRMLRCGTVGTTTLAAWQAITAGAFCIAIGSGTYTASGLNFSACADLDDVARVLQTGLRAGMASNTGFCRYDDNTAGSERFCFWLEGSGSIGYLTAPSTGTNIAGAGFLNGLTGAGTLGALLQVKAALRPHVITDTLPDAFLDRYAMPIVAGAISELCGQTGQPWLDQAKAARYNAEYEQGIADATFDIRQEFKDDDIRVGA